MDNFKRVIFGAEPNWTAILTATACGTGALMLFLNWFGHKQSWKKIQRAKAGRETSLQRAELAVLQFNESHPETDTSLILSLSLAELSKQLKGGTLTPEAVFHSYMEKTLEVNRRLNCCTEILLESWDQLEDIGSHKDGLLYGVPVRRGGTQALQGQLWGPLGQALQKGGDWWRGAAGGRTVCGPTLAGRTLSALHERGGEAVQREEEEMRERDGCTKRWREG
uniref:Fatty acid amide hydrolase n=1 Tax=Salmo trutta TaxID=8032 RepID=A0A673X5R1_SALTR